MSTAALLLLALTCVLFGSLEHVQAMKDKGGICEPREYFKEVEGDPEAYVQCRPKVGQVGEWELARCPKGEVFLLSNQKCKPASSVRRQQSLCQFQPYAPGCAPMNCPISNANPLLGGGCNWAAAGLIPFSADPGYFMQCTPAVAGAPCGVWSQMACATGSVFQPQLQVCVTSSLPPACQPGFAPVCPCGPLNLCPGACVCFVGVCCQPVVAAPPVTMPPVITSPATLPPTTPPTCPNGAPGGPGTPCVGFGQSTCQLYYECIHGACCPSPMPQCPNGQVAIQHCSGVGQSTCPPGYQCTNGGCCPLPLCPGGQTATQACGPGGVCPAGFQCQNGGCCPLPLCPNGVPAIQACSGPGTCPSTAYCFNGGCCPIPNCPNGQMASQPCTSSAECPTSFSCQGGGCCPLPLPTCPNGQVAAMPCSGPGTCPAGFFCQTGPSGEQGCCPVPNCPNGQPSIAPCGATQSCPGGYICQNNGCCPLPPTTPQPMCPNGQPGLQPCGADGSCPPNYMCIAGQCCYTPTAAPVVSTPCPPCPSPPCQPCCPTLTISLCLCAQFNNVCPTGAMCNQGTCCAPEQSQYYTTAFKPGDKCTQSTECPGYPLTGQCNIGFCVCIGSSRSNGFTCSSRHRRRYDPSESCSQFGTPCKLYGDRHERRRPSPEEMGIGNDTEPLWWQSLSNNCVTDKECTPDMMCIEGQCHPYLRPGDYHCQYDQQCNRTSAGSACVPLPAVNMTACRCQPGRLEFGHKCWRECPAGTRIKGQTCLPHKMEKLGIKTVAKRILSLFTPWSSQDEPFEK